LQICLEKQPPGPLQAIDCPGMHRTADPSSVEQRHAPYAVPAALHTWFEMHPPGPAHATDWPGTQEGCVLASTGAQAHGP
jgi:hypothetical protein